MKAVSKRAESVFRAAMARCGDVSHVKIDNAPGLYMALCVERIGDVNYCGTVFPFWSFAHYGEQNGDAMRDPDVCMLECSLGLYPVTMRQDYLGRYDDCLVVNDDGNVTGYRIKMQASITSFCNVWAANLKEQQKL